MDVFTAGADTSTYEQVPATSGGGVGVYRAKSAISVPENRMRYAKMNEG